MKNKSANGVRKFNNNFKKNYLVIMRCFLKLRLVSDWKTFFNTMIFFTRRSRGLFTFLRLRFCSVEKDLYLHHATSTQTLLFNFFYYLKFTFQKVTYSLWFYRYSHCIHTVVKYTEELRPLFSWEKEFSYDFSSQLNQTVYSRKGSNLSKFHCKCCIFAVFWNRLEFFRLWMSKDSQCMRSKSIIKTYNVFLIVSKK